MYLGGASIYVAGHVHLGDEILSVDGASMVGIGHATAVDQLKRATASVTLRLKSNKILEGTCITLSILFISLQIHFPPQSISLVSNMAPRETSMCHQIIGPSQTPILCLRAGAERWITKLESLTMKSE